MRVRFLIKLAKSQRIERELSPPHTANQKRYCDGYAHSVAAKIIIRTHENRAKRANGGKVVAKLRQERVVTIDENLLPTKSDVSATN